jgi:glucose-1-phosphate thymidylyltransferase
MTVIVFEDDLAGRLAPMTIGKPAFEIRCGSYRLVELLPRLGRPVKAVARPHLRAVLRADRPDVASGANGRRESVLLVNARMLPVVSVVERLRGILQRGRPAVVRRGEWLAAAMLPAGAVLPDDEAPGNRWERLAHESDLEPHEIELPLFEYPHDVLRHHPAALAENLADRLSGGGYREVADGVFLAPGATLGEYVVTDTGEGPIVLEENVRIGPYCYLKGPVHVGPGTRVIEHGAIKDSVALGHTCKIGGEVEASIIEPYTNKQHHGFLGHSYVGSWVNLGAGTCNSDLKNTYGTVRMEYDGHEVPTGMQFVGCIIGDYAKTAINTSIFTGRTIGACSMVYGFVTTNVPSFVNYARSFGQVTELPLQVQIATQARMFQRRNVPQRPCDEQLLRDMYELTRHERRIASKPLVL